MTRPLIRLVLQQYDQKNIRRRVYDALNVLMAMNIISKEKKEIKWLGLPTNSLQECLNLVNEKKQRIDRVKQKTKQLQEIILQVSVLLVSPAIALNRWCDQLIFDCAANMF